MKGKIPVLIVAIFAFTAAYPSWAALNDTLRPGQVDGTETVGDLRRDITAEDGGAKQSAPLSEIPEALSTLPVSRELFSSFNHPLSEGLLLRSRYKESPLVVGYDLAYFAFNPDAYLEYWRYVRAHSQFGKVGTGLVAVLLPYRLKEEATGLSGVGPENISTALQALNTFTSRYTAETVDLRPEDFGIVLSPEGLASVDGTMALIRRRTGGYPLTRLFARRKVIDAFGSLKNLVAFVFDLPFKDNQVGVANLEGVLKGEGGIFVNPAIQNISEQAADALRIVREILTKF